MSTQDAIARELKNVSKNVAQSSSVQSIGLLTDEEINELRILTSGADEEFARAKKVLDDDRYRGMYLQFADLGLVYCEQYLGGNVSYSGHTPKATWAVEHHDRMAEEERQRAETEERRHKETLKSSRWNIVIGWALGIFSSVLVYLLPYISKVILSWLGK